MAAPITHIILTNKIFNKHFGDKKKKDFFIGTSLPDIKYLKIIERDKTHFKNIALDKIKKENSFIAGFKFHSLLDIVRERFIISQDIYPLYSKLKNLNISLKFLEDDIFYNKINNWAEFIDSFNGILEEELNLIAHEKNILKWHKALQRYFYQQPNDQNRLNLILNISAKFSKKDIVDINKNIQKIRKDKKIIQIINELYDNFESILINFEKSDKSL